MMNIPRLHMPHMALVRPGEPMYSKPPEIKIGDLQGLEAKFAAMRGNLETFYGIVSEGTLLSTLIGLTSRASFMDQSLQLVQRDASFRNDMTKMLHGAHTTLSSFYTTLNWAGIFIDYFTRTPIPENIAAVKYAQTSLSTLAELAEGNTEFYESVKKGVKLPVVSASSTISIMGIDGLTFTLYGNDKPVVPRIVHADASTIQIGDQTFYNGLPADRAKYPTAMIEEGAQIALTVKNTTANRLYMVVPTINGIPIKVDQLGFFYDGFENSPFPAALIKPLGTYIKPGEEVIFDKFNVNHTGFIRTRKETYAGDLYVKKEEVAFMLARTLERGMTREQLEIIAYIKDNDLKQQILHESRARAIDAFFTYLAQARETPIYINRPEIADGKSSSELDNPFLGSLGLIVVQVSRPPVKDTHVYTMETSQAMYGGPNLLTKGIGGAGLAHIGGGADSATRREDYWSTGQFNDLIHSFAGYAPVNLMSLRR